MTLDVSQLTASLVTAFEQGKSATNSDEVAQAIAQAIHAYVSAATVNGVVVAVVNAANVPIGTGAQTVAVPIT